MMTWRVRAERDPMAFDVNILIGHDDGEYGGVSKILISLSENGMEFIDVEPHTLTALPRLTLPDDLAHALMMELAKVLGYSSERERQLTKELTTEKERTTILMNIVRNLTGRENNE